VPERPREWIAFILALCTLGVLVPLIVLKETQTSPRLVISEATATVATTAVATRGNVGTAETPTVEGGTTALPGAKAGARLVLAASRGESRIVVRVGSAHGSVVFEGTLAKGETRTFTEPVLWASFSAAENIDAHVNGQPLGLPSGVVSIVITPQGLG
jgi:Domain of unknown function (DUF4115)